MLKTDLCPDRENYYSQLNNEQDPKIACQSTTAAQCLAILGEVGNLMAPGMFKQPEDNLRWFCKNDPATMAFCIRSHGVDWDRHVYHPSEWADVLVLAINTLCKYPIARYSEFGIHAIMDDLNKGLPVQASMRFPGIAGHYISVVGLFDNGDLLINDPYRDWLHNKEDGFHVRYTLGDWTKHSKGYGLRYAKRN